MSSDSRRLFTDYQVRQLLIACNCRCQRCGADLTNQPFEAHHIRRHTDGGQTQLYNGMILCKPCHREVTSMPSFQPREWQKDCFNRFQEKMKEGKSFIFEACMGAGKSSEAAMIAKSLLEDYGVNHILALVPWRSIQGDIDKGMLGTFGEMGIDARPEFFTLARRQVRQPRPRLQATVTLYQEVCCQEAIDTIRMWKQDGFSFALICDEIHHTNEINGSWGTYVEQLESLAAYSVFMSGTFFRTDKKPISCIPLDTGDVPIKHYRYPYAQGVTDNVVRAVTTRNLSARVTLVNRQSDDKYEIELSAVTPREFYEAKKQVLDPNGECMGHMIETVHSALMQTRSKFPDAACLFVCLPGGSDTYALTNDDESQEDRHINIIAKRIQQITGQTPTVVTHRDRDAIGKIARFRRGTDPYLVAINMVSEGCDIPRLRAVAFCRYTNSEMLFRQIVGRALRMHTPEDGTAAQIYIPAFPLLIDFAQRLYSEAQEGIKDRRCKICGQWPCACPCAVCGQHPCICPPLWRPPSAPSVLALDAKPLPDGGNVGPEHIAETYVSYAKQIAENNIAQRHSNHTQLGQALQQFQAMVNQQGEASAAKAPTGSADGTSNPIAERDKLVNQIHKRVKQLAFNTYQQDFKKAYYEEIQRPFQEKFSVIIGTWPVEKLRKVGDRLERRIVEAFRNAS